LQCITVCSDAADEYLCRAPIVVCRPPIIVWMLPGAIISIYAAQSADSLVIFCSCRSDAEKTPVSISQGNRPKKPNTAETPRPAGRRPGGGLTHAENSSACRMASPTLTPAQPPLQGIASRKPFILLAFRGYSHFSEMGLTVH
jgi:hypothetical protein